MSEVGISAFGAYVPRMRIDRALIADAHRWAMPGLRALGKGSRAFLSWDEDAITMAVEAARGALGSGDAADIAAVRLASTTLPYTDLQNAAIVAEAIGAPRSVSTSDACGSQRAGTSALLQALRGAEPALIVASDAPRARPGSSQEMTFGAGAAAFAVSADAPVARLLGAATVTDVFVDHFRASDAETDYGWEERWVRDEGYAKIVPAAVEAALTDAGVAIGDIRHFVMPSYLRGAAAAVARTLKFTGAIAPDLDDGVGYAGAAQALLMLAAVLETAGPGERILLVGFGQGADAMVLETTDALPGKRPARGLSAVIADAVISDSYLRMLSFAGGIDLEWGMRAEKSGKTALTEQYRSSGQIAAFRAGKCPDCGTVQFPQLQFCVDCHAPAARFEQIGLADEPATVLTSTADWLSYHPAPPLHVGFVQFANGARVLMEMVDVGPGGVDPGQPLRMVYRIKERDKARGYNRYFWKSTPISAS